MLITSLVKKSELDLITLPFGYKIATQNDLVDIDIASMGISLSAVWAKGDSEEFELYHFEDNTTSNVESGEVKFCAVLVDKELSSRTYVAREILKMQDNINTLIRGEDWKDQGLDWRATIIMELAEALESSETKWWKKNTLDLENIKTEIVDLFHFVASLDMTNHEKETIIVEVENLISIPNDKFSHEQFRKFGDEMLYASLSPTGKVVLPYVFKLAHAVGMNSDEVLRRYIVKNTLNMIRQEFGYKEGEYVKIWGEHEDNVVALDLCMGVKNPTLAVCFELISKYYISNVVKKK